MKATKAKAKDAPGPTRARLLVVEDEQDLQDLLKFNLARDGFSVECVDSGGDALAAVASNPPDLVLLDLMLPGMDGLEVCRAIKHDANTAGIPIVMLTAKGEEADIVTGLEMGADDYVVKPFSPRVLIARLKAVLRRRGAVTDAGEDAMLRVGDLVIDPQRHEIRVGEQTVELTATEFRIVQMLARRPGRVFTRGQIVQQVQGDHVAVTDRSVDVHIVSLRRKLNDAGQYIQTVRGVGYRLEEK